MAFTKRTDGRKLDELRKIEAEVGVVKKAVGSARFKMGNTEAIAAVYGPKDIPRFLQDAETGVLICNYNMMAFSGNERVRPGPSRRSREISMVTEKALLPVLDLKKFPATAIEVYIEITQADSGTRCAGINAASLALADAGVPMKDLITSVAVGRIENKIVVDVSKEEEDYEGGMADIATAFTLRENKLTLLQIDGEIKREQFKEALEAAKLACQKIKEIQIKALKGRYKK